MLYSYIYQKKTTDCSWDIAHLYEHAFVYEFYSYLSKNGVDPAVFGWLDAQTFEHSIFIFGAFYNKKIADLFNQFITQNNVPNIPIEKIVKELGVEDNVIYTINNEKEAKSQLEIMNKLPWIDVESLTSADHIDESQNIFSPLSKGKSAKSYKKLIISFYVDKGNSTENALFIRYSVIIDDIISIALYLNTICHGLESSPVYEGDKSNLTRIKSVAFQKTISIDLVKMICEKAIKDFDVENNYQYIKDHFTTFAEQPTWRDFSIEYFRHTGILASNKYISSLCTVKNIKSLMSKIKIKVNNQTPALKDHLYN